MHDPRPATDADIDPALELVVREQQRHDRAVSYLGEDRERIVAELEALEPPWRNTLRVVTRDGLVVGAVAVEYDPDEGRAWVMGPWVEADGDEWDAIADRLAQSARDQLPDGLTDVELCGFVPHVRLAALGSRMGLARSAVNHVLQVTDAVVASWPDPEGDIRIDAATIEDLADVRELHDAEFPGTHTSAVALLSDDDRWTVLVARSDGCVVGYAAGQVHADGEAYVDYLVVGDDVRGRGIGRTLLIDLVRRVSSSGSTGRVCLTVEDRRAPARRLYEALGFTSDGSIVGHRTPVAGR